MEAAATPVGAALQLVMHDDDLLFTMMLQLDARSLAICAGVSRRWRLLSRACRAWVPHCAAQWRGKQVPWAHMASKPTWFDRFVAGERLAGEKLTPEELQRRVWLFADDRTRCKFLTVPKVGPRLIMDFYPPLPWAFNEDGTLLQISHFPLHSIARLPNWGFKIFNEHVHMLSLPDEHNLPEPLLRELADPESLPLPSAAALSGGPAAEALSVEWR